jgi:hypothetical protein
MISRFWVTGFTAHPQIIRVDERITVKREIHFGKFISILLYCFVRHNNIIEDSLKTQDSLLRKFPDFLGDSVFHDRNVLEEWEPIEGDVSVRS